LTITQDMLIKEIARKEDIDTATMRNIFRTLDCTLFEYLSSATPSESILVKILSGLTIECNYVPERTLQRYETITCTSRLWAKPRLTRYFNRKLNS